MRFPTIFTYTFALTVLAISANASTETFTLNQQSCSGTCGVAPYATVTLTDNGTGSSAYVSVIETLITTNGTEKWAGTGAGEALGFNLLSAAGTPTITIASTETTDFAVGSAYSKGDTGSFANAVTCLNCTGSNSTYTGTLNFNVTSTLGVTVADFTTAGNGKGFYFASDIMGNNGNTGNVEGNTAGVLTAAPEPGTVGLMLSGILLTGFGSLRRKLRA